MSTALIKEEIEYPGFTRLSDGRVVSNRVVDYTTLSVSRLNSLLGRCFSENYYKKYKTIKREKDIEKLKDYKWMLLFDEQACIEKKFMWAYLIDGGFMWQMRNKFWLVNIDNGINALGGNVTDLTNNVLLLNLRNRKMYQECLF